MNIKGLIFLLITTSLFACTSDKQLEKRIVMLERRVAALETGTTAANKASETKVKLANTPQKVVDNTPKPAFTFEDIEYDFGTVNEGDIVEYTFNFTNSGKSILMIDKATASCGCTVPQWPKEPIPVGGDGEIKVRFDTKNKPNQQIKTITISANTDPALTRLRIKGFVTPKSQQTAGPIKN